MISIENIIVFNSTTPDYICHVTAASGTRVKTGPFGL
jgi:hypothetical protein